MPTKDIDEEIVRYLLHKYLKEVNSVLWILPYVYELSIVLICKKAGESVSLYLQLHYSIVFLLRKENIYE